MDFENQFSRIYSNYDRYLVIPVALLAFAILVLAANYATTGELVAKGTDFTGGTEIVYSIQGDFNPTRVEKAFSRAGRKDVKAVRQSSGNATSLIVQVPPPSMNSTEAERVLADAGYRARVESFRSISAAVSAEFFSQARLAFIMAFTIMSLVIFVAFKDIIPSLAVIFAATGDIVFAAAGMSLVGIPLTLGSLAALLMLIGYSVDTDIVLSTRVLKRTRGSLEERIWSSVKTGVTMSSGGIAGFTLLYTVAYLIAGPSELTNIAGVMVIGLLADMPFTWFGNAIILKKYQEGQIELFENMGEMMPWT
ncbi:MAG: protein translocase subunit SecF [Candidatus Nanohaloarchaea archaeon]